MPGNENRAANGISEIVFLIRRYARLEVRGSIKHVVPHKLVNVAVKGAGARFGFGFNCSGGISAVLCAVIGRQHPHFGNGVDTGGDIKGGVAAVVHVIAPIKFPIVVFEAPGDPIAP